jgi:AraC family transcriptional regulator of adaptative response/methylated-DNA-[protein]-cysteine methyltransferase
MASASSSDTARWQAVATRDRRADGAFVYAVRTTGVYCRPSCPSRRPLRRNAEFFPVPAVAEQAGYRPCRRCRPRDAASTNQAVTLTERACRAMEQAASPLTLAALGRALGVSPGHLQRVFARVTGVSPRAYADALRAGRLRGALRSGTAISGAMYGAGYGSPSRIYDRTSPLGMTPGTYRKGGKGMQIGYTIAASPLGQVMVAATQRGLCFVSLGDSERGLERDLRHEFPEAEIHRSDRGLGRMVAAVLGAVRGKTPDQGLPLDIQGTAFQRLVWDELRRIERGKTLTYAELARRIGKPQASRAVAGACASNHLAVVVPCHRVVRSDGGLGGYRWGIERKAALLKSEK